MPMSDEHKQALAKGRRDAGAVRRYLDALASRKPGRSTDPQRVEERVAKLDERIGTEGNRLRRLELYQKRLDLQASQQSMTKATDIKALEKEFIAVAKGYSQRKGIGYGAWREAGVAPDVLRRAGIPRTRRRG